MQPTIAAILMTTLIAAPGAVSGTRPDMPLSRALSDEHKTIHGRILAVVHYSPPDRTIIVLEESGEDDQVDHHVLLLPYSPTFSPHDKVIATGVNRSVRRESYDRLLGQWHTLGSQLSPDAKSLLREYTDVINGYQVLANEVWPGLYPLRRVADVFTVLDYVSVTNIEPS